MRITTIFGTSITLAAGILIGWSFSHLNYVPSPSPKSPTEHLPLAENPPETHPDMHKVERLLNASRPLEALAILSGISNSVDLNTPHGKEWLRLLVDAYAATDNQHQLILIYNQYPEALQENEHASLAVADHLLEGQHAEQYEVLRQQWLGSEKEHSRWVFLDTQAKILSGNEKEAINLLQIHQFKGKDEIDRLVRLAALYVIEDPKRAWNYLAEATKIDPQNSDLHTFKASLGESLNQEQVANINYINAIKYDPENPYRREQLADFYLRTGQYGQALEILSDTMDSPSLDSIWLKTLFWSQMAVPTKESWKKENTPEGSLKDFVVYLLSLPSGIYWDPQLFSKIPNKEKHLETRQETFWLQLLKLLKTGSEHAALDLLKDNKFQYVSWSPELEKSLKTLLTFRLIKKEEATPALSTLFPRDGYIENPHQLVQFLGHLSETPAEQLPSAIPQYLQDFLLSKEAFTVPFLAVGWTEAAIQLHTMENTPSSPPGWIAEAFTQALYKNRDAKTALAFAVSQTPTSALSLLIAEIALEEGEKQIAFNNLKQIYTRNDESGRKAALILGQFLVDHDNLTDAKKALLAQPSLANDVTAKETLARIALQEGDPKKAYLLYLDIEKTSAEAKSFLARKAFVDKQWTRARELTEALLKEHPENPTLTDNLQKIIAEEKRKKLGKSIF